ncbi:uroporphyrinogen-III synthase [Pseudoxanthomonas daejeonensis]|uniref:uroporphyrinogen-III synthase n=1 Tax=Pseudoxanthomonas daejeonensis TaxID=266062 RepID=UPI001F541B8E|nr:uroporphyrinogen-III synthase [Pseudoxanthomonas daejeonensis]UNK58644.1 uroporphyrinogen-III synthase [Pseudoxanthomonas daejeonensis]
MSAPRPPAWYLISLRAQADHSAPRRAAARHGGGLLPLSPWRIRLRDDAASRQALEVALDAPVLVFTSPAAVRAAVALRTLSAAPAQQWLAVGAGTAAALRRAGIGRVQAPSRMDSEGLLALPALAGATRVGLVTAPEGRGLLAATLADRGTRVDRADVYQREPLPLTAPAVARLAALQTPACLALSSELALRLVLPQLPPPALRVLQGAAVAAASPRLAGFARELGWQRVVVAGSPRPAALVRAAVEALSTKV